MEYFVAMLVLGCVSVYMALSARYPITNLPWILIFKEPGYFGETEAGHNRLYLHLAMWVVMAMITAFIGVAVLTHITPVANAFYLVINYTGENTGAAGLITKTIFCLIVYLYFVRRGEKLILGEKRGVIPIEILDDDNELTAYADNGIYDKQSTSKNFVQIITQGLKELLNFVPGMYAQCYRHFLLETDHIVEGCADKIISKYGPETIVNFFHYHLLKIPNRNLEQLLIKLDEKDGDDLNKAKSLLTYKFRIRGYHSTIRFIESWLTDLNSKENEQAKAERPERLYPKIQPEVTFNGNGFSGHGYIAQFSSNYKGLFLATNENTKLNDPISIEIDAVKIKGTVVHKNMLTCGQNRITGCGVNIVNDADIEACKTSVSSLETET